MMVAIAKGDFDLAVGRDPSLIEEFAATSLFLNTLSQIAARGAATRLAAARLAAKK
jgi:hypothetical protein